ncbi:TonB-dependent receptor [Dyella tabacisoli]|uniref:TonB-dependent receptor n=1 Tax=Dyella tabacisoli TaxID=2282381 RepID=A0A369ULI6_9GAMM|nr:TonB-dependent receptor [Dyella tabacisoli]
MAQDAGNNQAGDNSQNDPHKTAKPVKELATVSVSGIRASLQKSIDIKRNADSIVDAITAEDVGKFPDTNVAESLSHLPGITVDRNFGEGEKVSILGTDPALNRLLLNGQTIAATNWAGDPNNPDSRSFNYSLLAPEIIGTAQVYKTPQARIDEGSIGGTVIVNTRRPLDLPVNTLTGTVSYGYNDRADKGKPNASVLYSWKNSDDTFGVLGSLMHSQKVLRREGTEVFGYQDINDPSHPFPKGVVPAGATGVYPTSINTALFQQERKRDGVSTGVQWKPNKSFELNFTGLYVVEKFNNFNQSHYGYWGDNPADATSLTMANGVATSGSYGKQAPTYLDGYLRNSKVKTGSLNLRADWYGEGWDASSQVGYTSSQGGSQGIYSLAFKTLGGYNYTLDGKHPVVNYNTPPTDAAAAVTQSVGLNYSPQYDRERYFQFDFSHDVAWWMFTQLQVGIKATNHSTGQSSYNGAFGTLDGSTTLAQLAGGLTPSGFLDGLTASQDMRQWTTISPGALRSFVDSLPGASTPRLSQSGTFGINEHNRAAYLQANFSGNQYRGNIGVRYVHTRDGITGYNFIGNGAYASVDVANSYNDWLPSFNFAYDLRDDLTLRFAAAKVIARPRYQDMSPYVATDDRTLYASSGNPGLKPYKSTNYDASAEWYFTPSSLLSAELFFRNISQYVLSLNRDLPLYNLTEHRTDIYHVNLPVNAGNAKVKGISLTYQGDLGAGFGVAANYTYSGADTTNGYNLPYNSKNAYNLTPYFEQGAWSARVNLGWRSAYFTSIGHLNARQMTDSFTELDASVGYQINKNLRVSLDATNLLDETYYSYDGTPNLPYNTYKNGRTYMLGLNFKL